MTQEQIQTQLEAEGIDTTNCIIESNKTVYLNKDARNYPLGTELVGMYSRELRQDFWFYSGFHEEYYMLLACYEDRDQYPKEKIGTGYKYQIPLAHFKTLEQVLTEKRIKNLQEDLIDKKQQAGTFSDVVLTEILAMSEQELEEALKPEPAVEDEPITIKATNEVMEKAYQLLGDVLGYVRNEKKMVDLTAKEFFAILHRKPCSGTPEIDDFIRENNHI
jgi:hypothetical protein